MAKKDGKNKGRKKSDNTPKKKKETVKKSGGFSFLKDFWQENPLFSNLLQAF